MEAKEEEEAVRASSSLAKPGGRLRERWAVRPAPRSGIQHVPARQQASKPSVHKFPTKLHHRQIAICIHLREYPSSRNVKEMNRKKRRKKTETRPQSKPDPIHRRGQRQDKCGSRKLNLNQEVNHTWISSPAAV